MAMIKCSECGTEISDKAEKCPKCACPISNTQTQDKTQVIEQTSKKYKKQIIYAILATIIGIIVMISSASSESGGAITFGILLTLGGLIWLFAVKIKIWWHHK